MAKTRSLEGAERSPSRTMNPSQKTSAMTEASTESHLDKMGRELKCPICLSLLDQAASLTCNHVFCNACILRSIKSACVCPVCKVPCSRREVRLAPHMDSLVIIYRNMKIAAGVKLYGLQPCMSKNSRDDPGKENIIPSQNGLKRKPSVKSGGKPKRPKGCGLKPSRLSVVSSHQAIENKITENIEQVFPAQATPSPHRPVKHSFPTKKRIQVSLYPPGSVEQTPLRTVNKPSNSEDKVFQSEGGGINGNLLSTNLDTMHFDSEGKTCLQLEPETGVTAQNSIKDNPASDRVLFDEHGNPLLSPFFWLRDREIEEVVDGTQMPNSQPTQFTQTTQASPSVCPSFSDLKDSDDEGYHRDVQNDGNEIGITVPDTFDSEMFEWTQRPCSPELNSSPRKQQFPRESEAFQIESKSLEGDDALLVNGVNKSHEEIIPVNAIESANGSDMESEQEKENSSENANVGAAGLPKKPSRKEKVKFLDSDEQICHEMKKSGNVKPKAEAVSENAVGKKKRGRKPKRSSGRNLNGEGFSHVRDSAVIRDANESLPDSDKELAFTTADIFDVMFGLPASKPATDSCVSKTNSDTGVGDQECHHPLDIPSTAQNEVHEHLAINLAQVCQSSVGNIVSGGNLETTIPALTTERQPEVLGNSLGGDSSTLKNQIVCAFCQTSGDSEAAGQMMHYNNGRAVTKAKDMSLNVVHVHKFCAEWAPVVYFKGDCIMNLETEISRGIKIKCSICGLKGAALGCCFTKCHRSFHVPCALSNSECRWEIDDYVMLCPAHASRKFPKERKPKTLKQDSTLRIREKKTPTEALPCRGTQSSATVLAVSEPRQRWTRPLGLSCKWVLCGSALDTAQKETLNNFAHLVGATISKAWSPAVTHVIASTDTNGACRRTLKFLMAILEGKWILNLDWITSCLKEGSPVPEEGFEITHDIHGTFDGPKLGRLRVQKQEPKLFEGLSFYLSGEFAASLKGYLQDLVSAAGGVVLHRKPIMDQPDCHSTIVLYNVELQEINKHTEKLKDTSVRSRLKQAKSLADALGSRFAAHTWVLDSIAASQLQPTSNGC